MNMRTILWLIGGLVVWQNRGKIFSFLSRQNPTVPS